MLKFSTWKYSLLVLFSNAHHLTYMSFGVQPTLAKAQYTQWLCKLLVDQPYEVSQLLLAGWHCILTDRILLPSGSDGWDW